MNSSNSIGFNALNIFPAEIWYKIFTHVQDHDLRTQARVSQVCQDFLAINEANNLSVNKVKIDRRWQLIQTKLSAQLDNKSGLEREQYLFFLIFQQLPKVDRELNLYVFFNKASMDVNIKFIQHLPLMTPLMHIAKFAELVKIGKFLLDKKGAEVNIHNAVLSTPLHQAARFDNSRFCQILVEKGAGVNSQDQRLKTPLHEAASACKLRGGWKAYDYLSSLPTVDQEIVDVSNKKARDYLPPFKPLSESLLIEIFDKISDTDYQTQATVFELSKGFKEQCQTRQKEKWRTQVEKLRLRFGGLSAENLFLAVLGEFSSDEIRKNYLIAILQTLSFDPNFNYSLFITSKIKSRPLVAIAGFPDLLVVAKLLLAKGASVDLAGPENYTALHWASKSNNLKMCELLIAHGANFNAQTTMGSTPLHEAARAASQSGDTTVYNYLLNLPEVNRDVVDQEGKKASDYYQALPASVD